jgi:hypothetical protein
MLQVSRRGTVHTVVKYSGMTTNERLFVADLMGQFDAAVARGDRSELVTILRRVAVREAGVVADSLLKLKLVEKPE